LTLIASQGYGDSDARLPSRSVQTHRGSSSRGPGRIAHTPVPIESIVEVSENKAEIDSSNGVARILATAGGAGYAPIAPGTFGSMVGVVLFVPLSGLHPLLFALTTATLLALGTWAADRAEIFFGKKDDRRIVIDEVVGQLIALAPLLCFADRAGVTSLALLGAGFLLFRLFDIWKPGPVGWAERRFAGGAGVMLDDVVAGALAALLMIPLALFWSARVASP
jgi:phosphatidylglycerophosphatase A